MFLFSQSLNQNQVIQTLTRGYDTIIINRIKCFLNFYLTAAVTTEGFDGNRLAYQDECFLSWA